MPQLTLQGLTIAEHEKLNRKLHMRIIKLERENARLKEEAMNLKEFNKYIQAVK